MGVAIKHAGSMPPAHPAAKHFPLMPEAEIAELADDIAKNGQREPIILSEGQILDGRNRWLACRRAGVEPRTAEWDGRGSAVAFIASANLYRRHLSPAERASLSTDMLPHFQAEAKARMAAGGGDKRSARTRSGGDKMTPPDRERDESQRAVAQAAKACGVSVGSVKTAVAIKKAAPEVFELLQQGKANLAEAKRIARLPGDERRTAVAEAEATKRGRPHRRTRTKINPTAHKLLDGTPVAEDRAQLRQLARLPAATQKEVARRIARGDEATVVEANEALIANAPHAGGFDRVLAAALALSPDEQRRLVREIEARLQPETGCCRP